MKRIVSALLCVTIAGLLLASCSPQPTTQSPSGTTTSPAQTSQVTTTAPSADKPQYGGTIVAYTSTNWQDFDEIIGSPITFNHTMRFTNQELWTGDWSAGPAGTNENPDGGSRVMTYKVGDLAESWNFDGWDAGKLVFNIRKGVHWALNTDSEASRLVNGREVTADDVVFSFKQVITTPTSYIHLMYPQLWDAKVYAQDKYTFVVEGPTPTSIWVLRVTDFFHVVPHEVVEKYGNMRNWRNSVGSGPWMLDDVVDNSSVTLVRNPNYWMTDTGTAGKGNQLPYADKVKFLIIADTNTYQSAFRAGRIDVMTGDYKDGPNFIKALPDCKYWKFDAFGGAGNTSMRTDKEPFNDIRVRKAMFKALDFKAIAEALYGQGARWLAWPIGYSTLYKDAYLDVTDPDCPDEVKDIYTYDTDAAIQLLKDAGYPSGIKGNCIVLNATTTLDYYQTIQTYWAKAGINITLDPREQGAWYTILQNRQYDFMMYGTGAPITNLHAAACMWGKSATNPGYIDDPKVNAAREQMMALDAKDDPAADKIHRELMKYVLAQCWIIPSPGGVSYGLWWPWLKQFYGGRGGWGYMNTDNWVTWAWVDTALKKSMGK
jgi:peptide/nickel transport system substrate-binding protein